MASSEFARKQLEKHGWKKGSGLGKDEHGMSNPIKVSLKMDKAGMGHDSGKEFTDHWWLRVFNDAAKMTGTKKQAETVESSQKKEESEMSDRKKRFYAGFVKSGTLQDGVEEKDKEEEEVTNDEEESSLEKLPTLDELHKLCGGANGSRAAAAGIKMSGKLARVAEQDRLFAEKQKAKKNQQYTVSQANSKELSITDGNLKDLNQGKRKKKKKRHLELHEASLDQSIGCGVNDTSSDKKKDSQSPQKKKKKRKHQVYEENDNGFDQLISDNEVKIKKTKRKLKNTEVITEDLYLDKKMEKISNGIEKFPEHRVLSDEILSKKKRKQESKFAENIEIEQQDTGLKRKRKNKIEEVLLLEIQPSNTENRKKKKKQLKNK